MQARKETGKGRKLRNGKKGKRRRKKDKRKGKI